MYIPYGINVDLLLKEAIKQKKVKSTHVISSDGSQCWELRTPSINKILPNDMSLLASGFKSFTELCIWANLQGLKTNWIKKTVHKFPSVKSTLRKLISVKMEHDLSMT